MIEVLPSAAATIAAIGRHRPGYVVLPNSLRFVLELFPDSAMACALMEHGVWDVDRRDRFVDAATSGDNGFTHSIQARADSVFIDILDEAYKRGEGVVNETDVARAIAHLFGDVLRGLGIDTDALVHVTDYHASHQRAMSEQLTRTRARLLDEATTATGVRALLAAGAEAEGWVDWKRTLDVDRGHLDNTVVGLINANPLRPVHVVFGVEDDGTVIGQVDRAGAALADQRAGDLRDAIEKRLAGTDPPTLVRWKRLRNRGHVLWVLSALGRAPSTVVRTADGRFPMRSGAHTRPLRAPEIAALIRRPMFLQ